MSTSNAIDRPIFIVGPHRSGTTLLYGILAGHEDVGCLQRFNHRFPAHPVCASLLTGLLRGSTKPHEGQRFWDRLWTGADDSMTAADLTRAHMEFYPSVIARVLKLQGRTRFAAKYPRLSLRTTWLEAMFPDARFLHMARDWRAVVSSTLQRKLKRQKRGGGWFGVRIPGWRDMGGLAHEIAAGRQFRAATLAIEEHARCVPERFFRVDYAALCADPEGVLREVARFCELPFGDTFRHSLPRGLMSRNDKWRTNLSGDMIAAIRAEDPEFFARYEETA